MSSKIYHKPVMPSESIELLLGDPSGIYIDATLGAGGHSAEILSKLGPKGRVIGLDQDINIMDLHRERYSKDNRLEVINENFVNLDVVAYLRGIDQIDGILFDVGLSSLQIDDPSRGFSYIKNGPLDMRMDRSNDLSAFEVVNGYEEEQLADIIFKYGEERGSRRLAKEIVIERSKSAISETLQLASIIKRITRSKNFSSVKRVFQALRIEVNGELKFLELALEKSRKLLRSGGRIVVITFHSLEDRLVKRFFERLKIEGEFNVLTKKPLTPSMDEISENRRSKSAKLRGAIKI